MYHENYRRVPTIAGREDDRQLWVLIARASPDGAVFAEDDGD